MQDLGPEEEWYSGYRSMFEGCWQPGYLRKQRSCIIKSVQPELERDRRMTNRKRKVPTNSPAMAMKWLRGPLGSFLKKGTGFGRAIFSDSDACEIPVPVRFFFPKRPGRNPERAFMLSMSGGRCGETQFPKRRRHVWRRAGRLRCI